MSDESLDSVKKLVELEVNLRHLTNDMNAMFEKQRDLEKAINDSDKELLKIKDEIARYKWIVLGVAGALSFVYGLAQAIASSLNITILDVFKSKN